MFFLNYKLHILIRGHLRNMHVFLSISKFVVFISIITVHHDLKVNSFCSEKILL